MFSFFPLAKYQIEGHSMLPTLAGEERVLVNRWGRVKPGDIVIIRGEGKDVVKRLAKITQQGYFVEGDNKEHSTDSRQFGPVEKKNIIGKVIFRYGPGL